MSCIDHLISEGWFRASPHPPWPSENYELVGSRDRAFNPRHVPGAARVRHGVPADATGNRIARSLAVPTGGGAVCFGRVGDPRAKVDVRRHFHPRPATRLPFWPRSTSPRRPLQLEFPRSLPSASTRCDGRYLIGSVGTDTLRCEHRLSWQRRVARDNSAEPAKSVASYGREPADFKPRTFKGFAKPADHHIASDRRLLPRDPKGVPTFRQLRPVVSRYVRQCQARGRALALRPASPVSSWPRFRPGAREFSVGSFCGQHRGRSSDEHRRKQLDHDIACGEVGSPRATHHRPRASSKQPQGTQPRPRIHWRRDRCVIAGEFELHVGLPCASRWTRFPETDGTNR